MYNLLGFGIIIGILYSVRVLLGVDTDFYLDEVALLIVIGGTVATAVISFPAKYLKKLFTAPYEMTKAKKLPLVDSIEILVRTSNHGRQGKAVIRQLLEQREADAFLKEGVELLLMGLSKDEFKKILTERIYRSRQRDEEMVSLFRRLAKYPPALGLVGTVLGLVSLMRSVGAGADASQIGINM
ncbi:MAG: MotA/TolQ/ExbB proton channel family protein, partial [Bdellovibrionales bacterium]|nr:MotA/TolQ/ExbB proton channel family protein [Bdellovibrionales bacterium]